LRLLRGLFSPEEALRVLDLAGAVPFSAVEAADNPVVTPLQVLAHDGVWRRHGSPLAEAVESVVEGRLLPYLRSEFRCPSLTAAQVMLRRYAPERRRCHRVHFDHNALCTAVVDLTPEPRSGLFVGPGADAASMFFAPFAAPGDAAVHGWDVLHGVRLREGHERVSIVVWAKPLRDVEQGTTSWYQKDLEQGNPDAAFRFGLEAEERQDFQEARAHLTFAAERGHTYAMHRLAKLLTKLGEETDARLWLTRAADEGFAIAQVDLADALRREGTDSCLGEAFRLYETAAAQGDGKANHRLSVALMFGLGVPEDREHGLRCLREAAAAGEAAAQLVLARLPGLPEAEAAGWLRAAADQGDPEALLQRAQEELQRGQPREALGLLRKAADAGSPKAVARLMALREALQEEEEAMDTERGP